MQAYRSAVLAAHGLARAWWRRLWFQGEAGTTGFDGFPLIASHWRPSMALPVLSWNAESVRIYSAWLKLSIPCALSLSVFAAKRMVQVVVYRCCREQRRREKPDPIHIHKPLFPRSTTPCSLHNK